MEGPDPPDPAPRIALILNFSILFSATIEILGWPLLVVVVAASSFSVWPLLVPSSPWHELSSVVVLLVSSLSIVSGTKSRRSHGWSFDDDWSPQANTSARLPELKENKPKTDHINIRDRLVTIDWHEGRTHVTRLILFPAFDGVMMTTITTTLNDISAE